LYFALYDLNDNLLCYYDDLKEISVKYGYEIKELNRKFRNSVFDYIILCLDNHNYKLYKFS
jgi:hypothetical protein